jgi:hypothetical protein
MSKTPRGKQYTFEDVARLVCKGADPPEGLVRHLRSWARPLEGFPKIEQEPPLGRKQMVDALKDLSAAADVILRGLAGQPMSFVMAPKYPPFDRISLIDLLWDLKRRCHDSVFSPPLSSATGGVKRGHRHHCASRWNKSNRVLRGSDTSRLAGSSRSLSWFAQSPRR